jgi:hypothetical protein
METMELELAQMDRRILAGERCVLRQREVLQLAVAAALPTEGPLQLLAEFETTLARLRRSRDRLSAQFAALTTQRLIESFWSLPAQRRRELATS